MYIDMVMVVNMGSQDWDFGCKENRKVPQIKYLKHLPVTKPKYSKWSHIFFFANFTEPSQPKIVPNVTSVHPVFKAPQKVHLRPCHHSICNVICSCMKIQSLHLLHNQLYNLLRHPSKDIKLQRHTRNLEKTFLR